MNKKRHFPQKEQTLIATFTTDFTRIPSVCITVENSPSRKDLKIAERVKQTRARRIASRAGTPLHRAPRLPERGDFLNAGAFRILLLHQEYPETNRTFTWGF